MKFMFDMSKVFSIATLFALNLGLGGCAMMNVRAMSDVPKAFNEAVDNTKNEDYPQLSQVPNAPSVMMTDAQWNDYEKNMKKTGRKLISNPKSHIPTSDEISLDWANETRREILGNPKAELPRSSEDAAAWAARMRALLGQKSAP